MSRNRKGLKPLSQTGLPRVPMNPRQRNFEEGGHKSAGTTLDAFNDQQDARMLHPTKGWRKLSVKRSRAAYIVAAIKSGWRMPMDRQRKFLAEGI